MTAAPPDETLGRATRLAHARSTYLRAAAEQSIDWHPWGTDPFELARRTGRPVLLDIGASWCHWCHVMDETTYSDAEVARLLGEHFVAIKVDRDEHPEIDRRYQRQVGALTGEGGWPLTAFLTPAGEVFLGGTFFPPTDGHGRPGFRRLLGEVARLWREEPERIAENARGVQEGLKRMRDARPVTARHRTSFAAEVIAEVRSSFDPVHSGFGGAPKFPHPTAISLLLQDDFSSGASRSAELARATLVAMGDGGMYDQVGGGFHRYSVDAGWHIPHFEKMAVDNAALLGSYVDGYVRFGDPRFSEVARGTIGWAREVLGDAAGGWGASQDADNAPGDDGGYFTWTKPELKAALDADELRLAVRCFGIGTDGQMPHDPDRNVLFRMLPVTDAAERLSFPDGPEAAFSRVVEKLKAVRDRRPTPQVDRALYADLNGRFLGAFARAGPVLEEPSVLTDARRAADRWIRDGFTPERGIGHRLEGTASAGFGLLDDQVSFASGLIELAGATAEARYAETAGALLDLVDREFRGDGGLFRDVAPSLYDGPVIGGIGDPSYPLEDSPHLSANSAAALAFFRLGALLHDPGWTEKGEALLAPLSSRLAGSGLFGAGAALAVGLSTIASVSVVIDGAGPRAEALRRAARMTYHPNLRVFDAPVAPPFGTPFAGLPPGTAGEPRALVCAGTTCAPPVTDPETLRALLSAGGAARPSA
ncbi:MAG: thioredoxin domain-containing protein [Thermoplasmata archaeon]